MDNAILPPDLVGIISFHVIISINTAISAMAHLFHSKSPFYHYTCFSYDYMGVAVHFQAVAIICHHGAGKALFYNHFAYPYLIIHSIFCVLVYTVLALAKLHFELPYSPKRKASMVGIGLVTGVFTNLPLFYESYEQYPQISASCWNHWYAVGCYIIAISIFAMELPEKIFPGYFDIIGHSHQWWHIVCTYASVTSAYVTYEDALNKPPEDVSPTGLGLIILSTLLVVTICLILQHTVMRPIINRLVEKGKSEKLN